MRAFGVALLAAIVCGLMGAFCGCSAPVSAADVRIYRNDAAGYAISYPSTWYPSPAFYSNAFEIRNYDATHSVPEKDQASIITSHEGPVTQDQAERRIRDLVSAASAGQDYHLEKLAMGQDLLYQWTVLERPAVPAGHPSKEKPAAPVALRLRVASAVFFDSRVVRMEGKARQDTDARVVAEMKQITRSIRRLTKGG